MPEAGRSFYCDMKHGFRYFAYIAEELPAICKRLFHISEKREDTAIVGASMGGYGALKCALTYPEQYGMCAAFSSGALFLRESLANQNAYRSNPDFVARFGTKLIEDFCCIFGENFKATAQDELLELAKAAARSAHRPEIYCTCGTQDPFYADHLKFAEKIHALPLDFTFEDWEGEHNFQFFDRSLQKTIEKFSL